MKIGSIHKTSLLDYPGKISTIIGTQGCNMRCPWCHNYYLIPYEFTKQSEIIKEKEFLIFLAERKRFLEGIVITGGEPTIQADLPEFCERVKELGFSVKLDTNGTVPSMLYRLLEGDLVDYIAMDVKTDLSQYRRLFKEKIDENKILESIDIVMSAYKPYEFRATCVSPFVTIENIDKIGMLIKGAAHFFLQKCNPPKGVDSNAKYEIINENRLIELQQNAKSYVLNCEIR
jgi:pyruvate formate lyase activating enzyme